MRGRDRTRRPNRQQEEATYEFDSVTCSMLESISKLSPERACFSLNFYKLEALKHFERGTVPIVEYYVHADMGDAGVRALIKRPQPWRALDVAEIFKIHSRTFTDNGVRSPVAELGSTLSSLLKNVHYRAGVQEIVCCFKIVRLCMDGMRMFPKERPRNSAHIPNVNFDETVRNLSLCRKEVKKVYKQCFEFLEMNVEPPDNVRIGWGTYTRPQNAHQMQNYTPVPTPPPVPMIETWTPTPSSQLCLGTNASTTDTTKPAQKQLNILEKFEVPIAEDREAHLRDIEAMIEQKWQMEEQQSASTSARDTCLPGAKS